MDSRPPPPSRRYGRNDGSRSREGLSGPVLHQRIRSIVTSDPDFMARKCRVRKFRCYSPAKALFRREIPLPKRPALDLYVIDRASFIGFETHRFALRMRIFPESRGNSRARRITLLRSQSPGLPPCRTADYATRRLRTRVFETPSSSNSSASFSSMTPPSCSASTIVTARR